MRVYMDGVFDLFHVGHVDAIKQCFELGIVVIGVVSDKDSESYKRKPIIHENMRTEMIESCKYVSEVVFPAPLYPTNDFLEKHKIDIVVHGFKNDHDYNIQKPFFKNINLVRTSYSTRTCTSDIIESIKSMN